MIKKVGSKYELRSKNGEKLLGTFDSKKQAEDREKEIQAFKNKSQGDFVITRADVEKRKREIEAASKFHVDLVITKASVLKDGTLRFQATCSDTEQDSRDEHTTIGLFADWLERIETGKSASFLPEPRMPFLGIAHYTSMEGLGEAGVIEKGYIDGNQFKVTGYFFNDEDHPCGPALFSAVQSEREIVQKGETVDNPIRISAAWWDLSHSHGDMIFERKSLNEECPLCEEGQPRGFLKGQVDHMAATRVPINPRTDLQLEEQSSNKVTRRDDAASIVGEELAEFLDKTSKPVKRSRAMATLSAGLVEKFFGFDVTSFDEAEDMVEAQQMEDKVWSNFDIFMMIMDNIKFSDDHSLDKIGAMEQAVTDFGSRISALKADHTDILLLSNVNEKGVAIMATNNGKPVEPVTKTGNAVDDLKAAVDAAIGNDTLDRTGKFAAIQPALEAFAENVKNQVDAVAPADVGEQLSQAIAPIVDKLDLLITKLGTQPALQPQQPVQRSIQPVAKVQPTMPNNVPIESSITKMTRRSVGIVE